MYVSVPSVSKTHPVAIVKKIKSHFYGKLNCQFVPSDPLVANCLSYLQESKTFQASFISKN